MEFTVSTTILSIVVVLVLTYAWRIANWAWFRPKQLERRLREQGYKGNPYKLLFGDAKAMISMTREAKSKPLELSSDDIHPRIRPFHNHCHNLFGNNYYIWLGPTPRVIISDPKLAREVLFNYEDFQKVQRTPLVKLLLTGLLGYEGKEWVMHRNLLNPAFNLDQLKHMVTEMNSSSTELISKWDALLSREGSCELDVWPFLVNFSGDVISRTAFGSNYEEGKRIFQLQTEQIRIVLQCLRSFSLLRSRFFPPKAAKKRLKDIDDEMGILLRDIINNKERAMKAGRGSNDLLGILLKTISGESQEQRDKMNFRMTIEEVIEECKLFYIAGQETSSVLFAWTLVLLSKNQKWQTLARQEVFAVFGDNDPNFDGLNQLKTVTMILYEVLRLYPPAPMTARRTYKKVKLGETVLPPGVEVELSFISIHLNPNLWGDDAKEFKPERFSEGIAKAARVKGAFFAFSGGPRICIGQNFALMEVKIALAKILRRFSFKLSPSYKHAPTLLLTVQPEHGAQLILQKI